MNKKRELDPNRKIITKGEKNRFKPSNYDYKLIGYLSGSEQDFNNDSDAYFYTEISEKNCDKMKIRWGNLILRLNENIKILYNLIENSKKENRPKICGEDYSAIGEEMEMLESTIEAMHKKIKEVDSVIALKPEKVYVDKGKKFMDFVKTLDITKVEDIIRYNNKLGKKLLKIDQNDYEKDMWSAFGEALKADIIFKVVKKIIDGDFTYEDAVEKLSDNRLFLSGIDEVTNIIKKKLLLKNYKTHF